MQAGPRQRQILDRLVLGQTDKQIAGELGISITTVRTYLVRLYRDNGFSNRTDAATSWLRVQALNDMG